LKLANRIKNELEKERIYTSIIIPGNQKIHICTGCMDCDADGICDFTDDMEQNIEAIKNEDIIMFITPTRWNLLSGDIKLFIDRLNPMYSRKQLKGKKMIAVSIGSKDKSLYSTEASLSSLISFAESAGMKVILDKQFYNCLNDSDILSQEDAIDSFINEIKQKIDCN
jgi:multimeric flavodoxin WrbA